MAFEDIGNLLKSPGDTFKKILDEGGLKIPLLIVLVSGLVGGVSSYYSRLRAIARMEEASGQMGVEASKLAPLMQEPSIVNEVGRMAAGVLLA